MFWGFESIPFYTVVSGIVVMYPQSHFLVPFIFVEFLSRFDFFSWKVAILAGIVGVLVDVDHLFEHVIHASGDRWNLLKVWNQAIVGHRWRERSFIHDTSGVLLITALLFFLYFLSPLAVFVIGSGYYSHILLDHVHTSYFGKVNISFLGLKIREGVFEIVLDVLLCVFLILIYLL